MKWLILAASLLSPSFSPAHAQSFIDLAGLSPYTQYQTFDTEHFHFIYQKGYLDFTKRAAIHLENAHTLLSPLLKWQPRGRTDILVADNEDSANGFTMPALRVGIVLIATPPDVNFSTVYTDDWIKLLVFHEYTHFLNIDPTTEWMEGLRIFFGDVIRPNGLWPVWMLEGLAVYFETKTSHLGRGRSPYYDAIVRAMVDEKRLGTSDANAIRLDRLNGDYPKFPGGEIPYLFGYHLWEQFSRDPQVKSSPESAMGELSIRSSARVPYFIEGNLENVMQKNWSDYWGAFTAEATTRATQELEAVKAAGESKLELLTHSQFSSVLGAISSDGEWMAYTQSSLNDLSRLVLKNLKTGEERKLEQKVLGIGMDFTPDSHYLIYSSLKRFQTYKLYSDILVYDLQTGTTTQLTQGYRAKDPSISPDGKHLSFIVSQGATHHLKSADLIVTKNGLAIRNVKDAYHSSPFAILGTPRFVSNDQIVFSIQEIGQTHSDLMLTSLRAEKSSVLFANGKMNRFPRPAGNLIYFTSDATGIDNVYKIDRAGKSLAQVTNVRTAADYPTTNAQGELFASVLTADGFEIARFDSSQKIKSAVNIQKTPAPDAMAAALPEPVLATPASSPSEYSPGSSLWPRQWAPLSYLTYSSDAGVSLGGLVLGFDSTGKHQYYALAGYNFKTQTVDGTFDYTYSGFRPIIDLFATTATTDIASDIGRNQYRRQASVQATLSYPIRWTFSSLTPRIYGFTSWNKVYDLYTNQLKATNDFEFNRPMIPGLGVSLKFSDAQTTRLGFMSEMGNDVIVAAEDRINPGQFSVLKYLASYTHYFGLGDHSVLVPVAKMLGSTYPTGFDRSWARMEGRNTENIFDQGTSLNLNRIGVRGYSDYTLLTRKTFVGSLDYHFPIFRPFFGNGTLPYFIKQVHGFVFGETAYIPSARLKNFFLPSYGAGLSVDTTLLVRAPVRFNLEFQDGTRKDYGGDRTVFLSVESSSLF